MEIKQQVSELYLVALRDELAKEAMKIILADSNGLNPKQIALAAYEMSNEMIKVRMTY